MHMGHSSLYLSPKGGTWGARGWRWFSAATSSGMAETLGHAAFPVTQQEGSIRQGQKVLETQSACMHLIPNGNFSEQCAHEGGTGLRRNSLCFRFGQ